MRGDEDRPEGETGWPLKRPLRDFPVLRPSAGSGDLRGKRFDNPDRDQFMARMKKPRTMDDILKDHARLVMEMENFDET